MRKLVVLIVVIAALAAGAWYGRGYAAREMSARAVTPRPLGTATPDSVGLRFTRLAIPVGERTIIAWWLPATADSGAPRPPALLFLHGNSSAMSDYVELMRFFNRQGISALFFDYSGFGASGGAPSLDNAVMDAGQVARVFADSAGAGARKVAMGSALGATVLLQAADSVQPHVDGLVIEGVDASVLEAAVRAGHVPRLAASFVDDPANNIAAAARVRIPLLAIHSVADERVPVADADAVVQAVPGRAVLVRHARKGRSSILSSSRPCDWAQVLDFVRSGTLPRATLDTSDACAAAPVGSDTAARPASDSASSGASQR